MQIHEKIKEYTENHREFFLIVFPAAIIMIYLGCVCFRNFNSASYYIYPALINGLMILFAYLAWRSYTKEQVSVIVSIQLSCFAVILPFAENVYDWFSFDWSERVLEFVWLLWPTLITYLSNYCVHKLSDNKKYIYGVNLFSVLLLTIVLHCIAEWTGGKNETIDLLVPVMWLAEGIMCTSALNLTNQKKHRKRNLMAAWMGCLLLFVCFTFADISYLSSFVWETVRGRYWNKTIFLCSPILFLLVMKILKTHITEDKPYFSQKRSLLYILIVLPLIYFITDIGLNFETGAWKYDIVKGFYLLFLADIILWKELYRKSERTGSRLKGAVFIVVVNAGVFLSFLIANRRLREIVSYVREFFSGSSLSASQVDWIGYRKTAFEAFLSKDLTVLDSAYGKERYLLSAYGHGLASIWFQYGMLPLMVMILLLIMFAIFLWNWNPKDAFLNQCAKYLAIGYIMKMSVAFILQANMIVSTYIEFPFSGMDIAEILLPILLVYESTRAFSNYG